MFSFIKNTLKKIYTTVTSQLNNLFSRNTIDETTLQELKILLLSADTGVATTNTIIEQLKNKVASGALKTGTDLREELRKILFSLLKAVPTPGHADTKIFLLVGINGSGKTTFIAKLAHLLEQQHKKVLLVAADTFRAAAAEQLSVWATKQKIDIFIGSDGQDPASVVFGGCQMFTEKAYDVMLVDTAGRLHNKTNLMNELGKIRRVIAKQLPEKKITTLLTVDAMLGQNSFEQAKLFSEWAAVNGLVLTKMDGTGKGGIIFAIAKELNLPVSYITFGEQVGDIKSFDAQEYVNELLS